MTPKKQPEPKTAPRKEQQRSIDTRERIIDAAIVEFGNHGFEGASTREVARQAGARHTLITYHFDGKEGLWRAVMARLTKSFVDAQSQRLAGLRGVDKTIQLKLLLTEFVRYSANDLNLHKIMTHAAASSPLLDDLVRETLGPYFAMIADLIKAAQKKGEFVEGDPNHLHYLFIGATTRIFMQAAEAKRILGVSPLEPAFVDRHIEACLGLFFRGVPKSRARPVADARR